jgi:endonuclease/exonuclease/phosphatase family metal-dependent hydrolase
LYWAFRLKRKILIPIATFLLGWSHLGALFPLNGKLQSDPTNNVRLVSYNIRQADPSHFTPRREVSSEIAELIVEMNPDMVAFQEYRRTSELDYEKGSYPFTTESSTTQIWSKYPILNEGEVKFPREYNYGGNSFAWADIQLPNSTVRLYNFHISSIRLGSTVNLPESFDQLDIEKSNAKSKKTLALLRTAFLYREKQLNELFSHIEASPFPVIVAGDLNDTPGSHAYYRFHKLFRDAHRTRGIAYGRTHTNGFYPLRIDYAFDNTEFEVIQVNTVKQKLSDHYPLVIDYGW